MLYIYHKTLQSRKISTLKEGKSYVNLESIDHKKDSKESIRLKGLSILSSYYSGVSKIPIVIIQLMNYEYRNTNHFP